MKFLKPIQMIGAGLTIVGSFLPWEISSGITGYYIYGVKVVFSSFKYWGNGFQRFPVYDYGGVLIILLTLAIIFLPYLPSRIVRNPNLWNLILAVALLISSLIFLGRGIAHIFEWGNMSEPPTLMFGLYFILLGSVFLLWRAVIIYLQPVQQE